MPSKVSVNSATRKMIKAFSAGLPIKAKINKIIARINLERVSRSAR